MHQSSVLTFFSYMLRYLFAGAVATAQYSTVSESIRGAIAEATMCSMFCGGKNCKYESAAKWTKEQQAIDGLYSSWLVGAFKTHTDRYGIWAK